MRTTILPPAPEAPECDTIPAPPPDSCYDCGGFDCDGACGARDDRPASAAPPAARCGWASWAEVMIDAALRGEAPFARSPRADDASTVREIVAGAELDGDVNLLGAALVALRVLEARAVGRNPVLAVRAGLALLSAEPAIVGGEL